MTVDVLDRETGTINRSPLSVDEMSGFAEVHLELASGASTVQVVVRNETDVVAAIEIPAQPGEVVSVEIRLDPNGTVRANARNRDFLVLPDDEPPKPLILRPSHTDELDLAILVDGTCLHPAGEKTGDLQYLLDKSLADVWRPFAEALAEFAAAISSKYRNFWSTVLAFGDEPMDVLANQFLKPAYLVYPPNPENRRLNPGPASNLAVALTRLPASPGGDFVDALADGLRACGQIPWRQHSRKLVVLFGQSPGYSVMHLPEESTNLIPRAYCIEEEIAALHRKGIEVVTIFHHPREAEERYRTNLPQLFQYSRDQYAGLASLREWGFSSSQLDPTALASAWLNSPVSIARGPSPGLLVNSPQ